jgi:hypothetical protein
MFLDDVAKENGHQPPFRIAESPIFIGQDLKRQIYDACDAITEVITRPDFKKLTEGALHPAYRVPNENEHSIFLQYDFGICEEEGGSLIPKLIEVQGFPTLYYYQDFIAQKYRSYFDVPQGYSHLLNGLTREDYLGLLRRVILGGHKPENVALVEVEPDKQPTRIDFLCTSRELGIPTLCISELKKEGRDVFYLGKTGKKIPVYRIYNRVIFDELVGRKDINREFRYTEEADVEWAGHPNWFFRISKYTLPFLDGKFVPKTFFLNEVDKIPDDLENYVLKPLYSFSGSGIIYNVTPAHFDAIEVPENFILQEKVTYSPVIESPEGKVKCEIRMLLIWEEGELKPQIVNNLARLSRGEMIGVKYNKDKTWVGGSVAFFEE